MTSVLFVIAFAVGMTGIGWSVVERLDPAGRLNGGERLALAFATGCYAIYFGVFAIGPFRLDTVSMWALALVSALVAVPGLFRMPWRAFVALARTEIRAATADRWTAGLWLAALAIALSSLLQGMAPPNDYDSLMYHLAFPQYDVEMGRSEIAWDRAMPHALFPAMASNLSRFALATMNAGVAQMLHGLFGIVAALGAAMLTLRLGLGKRVALIAAVFFLAIRVVVWEMATSETDVPVAAFLVLSLLVYLAWRQNDETGLGILFGLMVGGGILVKYHGFPVALSFAPLMLYDLAVRKKSWVRALAGPVTALAVFAPHMVRNFVLTHNPIFPLFNSVFNPGTPNYFEKVELQLGTGRGIDDLIAAPWNIFILPMHHFDGMVFGAPYLLAFCPLILLNMGRARRWSPVLSVTLVYFVLWFWLLSQQVRFLLPVMPVLAAVAAAGVAALWEKAQDRRLLKTAFVAVATVLGTNQAMFVGVYAMIRLPAAFGLMEVGTYLSKTPNLGVISFYETCTFIRENLREGERYFSLIYIHSYYCPQASATYTYFQDEAKWWLESKTPPEMSFEEFLRRVEKANFRFFIISKGSEIRRGVIARAVTIPIDITSVRFGGYLKPAFDKLQPVMEDRLTAVYDGPEVISLLKTANP